MKGNIRKQRADALLKQRCFSVNIDKFLRTPPVAASVSQCFSASNAPTHYQLHSFFIGNAKFKQSPPKLICFVQINGRK